MEKVEKSYKSRLAKFKKLANKKSKEPDGEKKENVADADADDDTGDADFLARLNEPIFPIIS